METLFNLPYIPKASHKIYKLYLFYAEGNIEINMLYQSIRGTFRHFVFRLFSLVRKTECLFISYLPFSIVRLIFDNFILCLLRFFHISFFCYRFIIYPFYHFLYSLFIFPLSILRFLFPFVLHSFFCFLILYSFFFFLPFFFFSFSLCLFFSPFSVFLFLFTFFLFLPCIFFFSLRPIPSNLCWHISRHFSPFPCELRLVPARLQTLTWRTLCRSKAGKKFLQ